MKTALTQLRRILIIDNEIDELINLKEEIPSNINALREELAKMEKENDSRKSILENLEKEDSAKALMLAEEKDRFSKSEEKLKLVTNNKEFAALQKEISLAKKNSESLQSDLNHLNEKISEERPKYESWLASVADQRENIEKKIAQFQDQAGGLSDKIEEKIRSRSNEEGIIPPELLKKYQGIKKRVSPAMSAAIEGTCSECNTRIPPQLYIEIQKMNLMQNCPRCFRILYIDIAE